MKRKALAIVLITIVALSVTAWFFYSQISELQNQIGELQAQNSALQEQNSDLQEQNSDLQNQTDELQNQLIELQNKIDISAARDVKITDFEWKGGWYSLGQVNFFHNFVVTVRNMGDNNVSGLTLSIKLLSGELNATITGYTTQFNIGAKQMEIFSSSAEQDLPHFAQDPPLGALKVCVITLNLGDALVDQWIRIVNN
jgi:cell division protein FtsB